MTVVRPNSIAGINSITVQTGQALNIHDASGNLIRNITSSTGISTFQSVEVTSGDLTVGVSTLFVDKSTGEVGIGTIAAARGPLHIHNNSADCYFHVTNGTTGTGSGDGFTIHQGGVETLLNNRETGNMRLYTAGLERIRIQSDGDVGIGTDAASTRLDVVDNSSSGYIAEFRQVHASNPGTILIDSPTDNNIRPVAIDLAQAGTVKWSLGSVYSSTSSQAFHICSGSNSQANSKFVISTSGQVGVNTSTFNTGSKLESSSEGAYNIVARSQNGNGGYHNFTGQSSGGTNTSYITHNGRGYFEDGVQFDSSGEVLDSYEEGTWTPEVRIETRAASDSPIDAVDGCYTKVGKLVTCHGRFTLNGTPSERSTSRAIELRGFPFDHNHDWDKISGDIRVTGHDIGSTYGEDIYFVIRMLSGLQYARIEIVEQGYNGTRNASVVMQNDMQVMFSFTYVTV